MASRWARAGGTAASARTNSRCAAAPLWSARISRSLRLPDMNAETTRRILVDTADRQSTLFTDERTAYRQIGKRFAHHESVNHKDEEYVRGPAHTNTAEGFFSIFKRGMRGVYQ